MMPQLPGFLGPIFFLWSSRWVQDPRSRILGMYCTRAPSLWGKRSRFDFPPYISPELRSASGGIKRSAYIQINYNVILLIGVARARMVSDPPAPPLSTSVWGLGSRRDRGSAIPLTQFNRGSWPKAPFGAPYSEHLSAGKRRLTSVTLGLRLPCRRLGPSGPRPAD